MNMKYDITELAKIANKENTQFWSGRPSLILGLPLYLLSLFLCRIIFSTEHSENGAYVSLTRSIQENFGIESNEFFFVIIALLPSLIVILIIISIKYSASRGRIEHSYGIFFRRLDMIETYRILDMRIYIPPWYWIIGGWLSNLTIISSDKSHPELTFYGIRKGKQLADVIRYYVEEGPKTTRKREHFIAK